MIAFLRLKEEAGQMSGLFVSARACASLPLHFAGGYQVDGRSD